MIQLVTVLIFTLFLSFFSPFFDDILNQQNKNKVTNEFYKIVFFLLLSYFDTFFHVIYCLYLDFI
jgi:hypothetical protein